MSEMYVVFIPVISGGSDVKSRTLFTTSSGLAKSQAEANSEFGATYHTLTIGSALPVD